MNLNTALLNVNEMAEADRLTIEAGTSGIDLMYNAGKAVADEMKKRWPKQSVAVLCGPGNNGGDGFVAARLLAEDGWSVRIGLLGTFDHLTGDAHHHAALWPGTIELLSPEVLKGAALIIDAIFGAGLSRAIDGIAAETLAAAEKTGCPIIAVDVPSGTMGDTGEVLGAVPAALTITYFRKKPGHLLLPGRSLCGEIVVADIGTPPSVLDNITPNTFENTPALWLDTLPQIKSSGNKYTRGHALVYGGYPMTGAARLAARAAARAGAGLVTIAVSATAFPIYAAALTSIMVTPLDASEDFSGLLSDRRFTGFLIGPGAGSSKKMHATVLAMLKTGKPVVIDADAITTFQNDLPALKKAMVSPCIMTPHEGEFKRLFDSTGDKLKRARAAAKETGAVIVLKGADTVIASPDGRAIINSNAPATLATAGAGDVLSGIILGLVTQGMEPFLAASAAVWLHGAAAQAFGICLMAEDIPDMLKQAFQQLEDA